MCSLVRLARGGLLWVTGAPLPPSPPLTPPPHFAPALDPVPVPFSSDPAPAPNPYSAFDHNPAFALLLLPFPASFSAPAPSAIPGMVVACLVKEVQITAELRKMTQIGLVPLATAEVRGAGAGGEVAAI